eukprot:5182964-Prymnesium_polylepis.1
MPGPPPPPPTELVQALRGVPAARRDRAGGETAGRLPRRGRARGHRRLAQHALPSHSQALHAGGPGLRRG